MERNFSEPASMISDPTLGAESSQIMKELAGAREGGFRRRREERERVGAVRPPLRQVEGKPGKVSAGDFRRRMGHERALFSAGPEPVAPARCDTAGATPALLRLRPGDTLGHQPRHSGAGIEAGPPGTPGIHDDADIGYGERGFRDRR